MTQDEARAVAFIEACKLDFDNVEFVKKEKDFFVFHCVPKKSSGDPALDGLPMYVEVYKNKVEFYTGFKY